MLLNLLFLLFIISSVLCYPEAQVPLQAMSTNIFFIGATGMSLVVCTSVMGL